MFNSSQKMKTLRNNWRYSHWRYFIYFCTTWKRLF